MTQTMKMDHNRPLDFAPEIAYSIIDRLTAGEPIWQICRDATMPTVESVHSWVTEDKELTKLYEWAMLHHVYIIFEEMIKVADDASGDWIYSARPDGSVRRKFNRLNLKRTKMRISERERYIDVLLKGEPVRLKTLED